MMTKEEKQEWIRKADSKDLLKQYETSAKWYDDPFTYAERYKDQGVTYKSIKEEYRMVWDEILRRMS